MKIHPIKFINISQQKAPLENQEETGRACTAPALRNFIYDTTSFSGKIPSISAPTMEDLINKTKAVDILRFNILRLAKYKIPCPCCGHDMLDVDTFNKFEKKVLATTNPGELLKLIGGLKEYLHPVESRIYSMMKSMNYNNPNLSLQGMLREKLPRSERKIVNEQSKIFSNLGIMSRKLPDKEREQVTELIKESFARIIDKRQTSRFSRKVFINKLELILLSKAPINIDNSNTTKTIRLKHPDEAPALSRKMIEEAAKLPTAYNNFDAFIVKYAKRNYKEYNPDQKIAIRMLSNSLATIEHITAQKNRGGTSPDNLALECACCNNRRNHDSILEQILQNPMMIINYPRYIWRLCEIHLMGKVEKGYITAQNKTFRENSFGILDADLSNIKILKENTAKKTKSGYTPSRAERREQRKSKLKLKKHSKEIKRKK